MGVFLEVPERGTRQVKNGVDVTAASLSQVLSDKPGVWPGQISLPHLPGSHPLSLLALAL